MAKSFEEMLGAERAALRGVQLATDAPDFEWLAVAIQTLGEVAGAALHHSDRVPCRLLRMVALITLWLDAIDARK